MHRRNPRILERLHMLVLRVLIDIDGVAEAETSLHGEWWGRAASPPYYLRSVASISTHL
jgi:hypothetical protein